MRIINLYWDLDGVCAKWNENSTTEERHESGYFACREYQWNVISAMYDLAIKNPHYRTFILSHYYPKGPALKDKNTWCDYLQVLYGYPIERIFVPYGESKYLYIDRDSNAVNILIDDYTKNLCEWENAGYSGIKFLNGINHTHRTWKGAVIKHTDSAEEIVEKVKEYIASII